MATKIKTTERRPRGAGGVRQLPSRRWQATFVGPDGVRRPAPVTFDTRLDAETWLAAQARDVRAGRWTPPVKALSSAPTFGHYAEEWLEARDLKPRTRYQYRRLLDTIILPDLSQLPLDKLSPVTVRNWHAGLGKERPTWRAQGYSLVRAICRTAVAEELMAANPCRVVGAGKAKTKHKPVPATIAELEAIAAAMPERYRCMVLLAAGCAMRFGELTELRRKDVDLGQGKIRIERGVVLVGTERIVGDPKTEAGKRTVAVPPNLCPLLEDHLARFVDDDPEALVFPGANGRHMAASALYKVYYPAREKAGRPDLRFHDLRHTGATLAAIAGATIAELQARLGHSTPAAAMRYQHAIADRDAANAAGIADLWAAALTKA